MHYYIYTSVLKVCFYKVSLVTICSSTPTHTHCQCTQRLVKVQTPLARLRHCCDTSWPLQGQRVHTREQDKTVGQHR